MNVALHEPIRPFMLRGAKGPLLSIYYPPVRDSPARGDILLAPPFAEEMNRCRAMVAMQARALASLGVGTLVVDPFGTGDSGGDFSDGTWSEWRDDLRRGIDWLRTSGNGCLALWGIRVGAIMAAELAVGDAAIGRLLLWQPVTQGKSHFTQFLRIRIAAELERRGGIKSTDELRQRSAAGENIEVSGYPVGPNLARELDQVSLPAAADLASKHLAWFEVLAAADMAHGNSRLIADYQAHGVDLDYRPVVGPQFWQLHERAVAPALLAATTDAVAGWSESTAGASVSARAPAGAPDNVLPPDAAAEYPLTFPCGADTLMAILHRGAATARRAVVIVVAGGPQYRAGAHRQFVSLARRLAERGYPVLRFDLRGMGDSSGTHLGYQQSAPDIRAAIDALVVEVPQIDEVVLLGECESASGILFYAFRDSRVKGMMLVNPWVRTDEGQAEVVVKHYYAQRLRSRAFWRKVVTGGFRPRESLVSLYENVRAYIGVRKLRAMTDASSGADELGEMPLPVKTAAGLRRFRGPAMILMSGNDYIAREFDEITRSSQAWRGLLDEPRIRRHVLADADHTFSRNVWKIQVADWVGDWLASW